MEISDWVLYDGECFLLSGSPAFIFERKIEVARKIFPLLTFLYIDKCLFLWTGFLIMGVYDFFKGPCPSCTKDIDDHPEFGRCGSIQTKYFIIDDQCFRNFYPQKKVPFAPTENNIVIGRSCCCDTIIKACFHGDTLSEYHVVVGKPKSDYIRNEIRSFMGEKYVPKKDVDWYHHYQKRKHLEMDADITASAWHPKKIKYYISIGYTIDDLCES